jgi:hypothetical protein
MTDQELDRILTDMRKHLDSNPELRAALAAALKTPAKPAAATTARIVTAKPPAPRAPAVTGNQQARQLNKVIVYAPSPAKIKAARKYNDIDARKPNAGGRK